LLDTATETQVLSQQQQHLNAWLLSLPLWNSKVIPVTQMYKNNRNKNYRCVKWLFQRWFGFPKNFFWFWFGSELENNLFGMVWFNIERLIDLG